MSEFDGDPPSGSAGTSADADLTALADETWDTAMRSSPLTATTLGDPRFHGTLADNSPSGLSATEDRLRALRQRAVGLPADGLDQEGLITRSALVSPSSTPKSRNWYRWTPSGASTRWWGRRCPCSPSEPSSR